MLILPATLTLAHAATDPQDPYETYNRHAYQLNKTLDDIAFKPVASAYNTVMPWPAKLGISHFFSNLNMVPTVANDILQGNVHFIFSDSWRFIINSTIGLLGLVDVASAMGLPPHSEDLGLTLAKWGYQQSHYLILPILGPSTVRDAITFPIDYQAFSVYPYIEPLSLRYSLVSLNFVSKRAQLLDFDNVLQQIAFDPYVFQRNAYLQRRNYLIQQNEDSGASDDYIAGGSTDTEK